MVNSCSWWVYATLIIALKSQQLIACGKETFLKVKISFSAQHFINVVQQFCQQLSNISKIKPLLSSADLQKVVRVIRCSRFTQESSSENRQGFSLVKNAETIAFSFTVRALARCQFLNSIFNHYGSAFTTETRWRCYLVIMTLAAL